MEIYPAGGAPIDWSPSRYLKFEDERTRPARDLLAQVPLKDARRVIDVGCGPGNSTVLLAERYPRADVLGIDTSPAMVAEAERRAPNLEFRVCDASAWTPPPDTDLVFANAAFQWVPNHLTHLVRILRAMRPGAVLAVQMPDNLAEPAHQAMREVAAAGPWSDILKDVARDPLPPPRLYFDALQPYAASLDIWHTIYNHRLANANAVVEFVRSTGLRPFIDPLCDDDRETYLSAYLAKITASYPPTADGGVLLRFPRLFIVAQRITE